MNEDYRNCSYVDNAFPIIAGQTISQPTTVMMMTQDLNPVKGNKILEIGTGSGYQAAILAEIINTGIVYTTEIVPEMYELAKKNLKYYSNVRIFLRDGSLGFKKYAPFDRIIITAACSETPMSLFRQLRINGILLAPIGSLHSQVIYKFTRLKDSIEEKVLGDFKFVPLKGKYGFVC
jgi:protein-L-isoaspartate(D-aspartate) O-methyltransferase